VRDLLDTSMAESGTLTVRPSQCSVRELVTEVAGECSAAAARRQIELTCDPGEDPFNVVTDPSRVRQILQNLVSNAVKYTNPGGKIRLSAARRNVDHESVSRDMIVVDVADTGPGIPPDQLEKVFEEFWRLESHRNIPGSGLGLSVARRIATLLDGTLTVESSPRGSTFKLWIPLDRRHQSTRLSSDGLRSATGWRESSREGI